jgi:single-strand DNA-binding protein
MASMNQVTLIGRLTKDPETRYTTSGMTVASFTVAVDRKFKDQATGEKKTDFFRCKAWRHTAEFVAQHVTKGRLVAVAGRIELNEYTGQDGVKKYSTDVVAESVELLDSQRGGESQ